MIPSRVSILPSTKSCESVWFWSVMIDLIYWNFFYYFSFEKQKKRWNGKFTTIDELFGRSGNQTTKMVFVRARDIQTLARNFFQPMKWVCVCACVCVQSRLFLRIHMQCHTFDVDCVLSLRFVQFISGPAKTAFDSEIPSNHMYTSIDINKKPPASFIRCQFHLNFATKSTFQLKLFFFLIFFIQSAVISDFVCLPFFIIIIIDQPFIHSFIHQHDQQTDWLLSIPRIAPNKCDRHHRSRPASCTMHTISRLQRFFSVKHEVDSRYAKPSR